MATLWRFESSSRHHFDSAATGSFQGEPVAVTCVVVGLVFGPVVGAFVAAFFCVMSLEITPPF